ncbi:MAG: hypothetical protein ACT4TC_10360, partial [Myxococcaceae bacterium]
GMSPATRVSYSVLINSPAPAPDGGTPNVWVAKPYNATLTEILKQVNRIDVVVEPNAVNQTFTFSVDTFGLQ